MSENNDFFFTSAWGDDQRPKWRKNLEHLIGQSGVTGLEVGMYEGRSCLWWLENILTGENSRLFGVDINEEPFEANRSKFAEKYPNFIPVIGNSYDVLCSRLVQRETFDFIYIDGAKEGAANLESMVISWPRLKVGGVMIIDDYGWRWTSNSKLKEAPVHYPKMGIDAFLKLYDDQYQVIEKGFQVTLQKTSQINPETWK